MKILYVAIMIAALSGCSWLSDLTGSSTTTTTTTTGSATTVPAPPAK